MPISDIFPDAGITLGCSSRNKRWINSRRLYQSNWKDVYGHSTNGPGITGLVTPIKTAYWNHTLLLLVTPQAANKTMGQGGFQEVEQMNLFKDMVCYQEEVRDQQEWQRYWNRVIEKAIRGSFLHR